MEEFGGTNEEEDESEKGYVGALLSRCRSRIFMTVEEEAARKRMELDQQGGESNSVKKGSVWLLVVDDDETSRDVLVGRLCDHGYNVASAAAGRDALNLIAKRRFDLAFVEVEMRGTRGLEVLSRIRERYSPIDLPVIMLTDCIDLSDAVLALDVGANDYITKPIEFAAALARVRTQLALKCSVEACREIEERYALALAGSKDGIWDWNLKTDEIGFSARWKSALGYEDHEIGSANKEWFDRIHPQDRSQVYADLKSHIEGEVPHFESEHR